MYLYCNERCQVGMKIDMKGLLREQLTHSYYYLFVFNVD